MSEFDILNPIRGYDPKLGDSMNPNQGWQRTRRSTLAVAKPAFGQPWTRESGNTGHIYTLNYTARNLAVTERLKQFFEQFETGFFTLRDYDNGRDYVGRFTGDMPQSFDRNGRFTSSGWTFEEQPGCPMLQYPNQWERWGIQMRPFDDYGDPRVATSSANWTQPAPVADEMGILRPVNQLQNLAPAAGDTATFEYRGYGFRLWALQGPSYGNVSVTVDGTIVGVFQLNNAAAIGTQLIYDGTSMPLDIHRVVLAPVTSGAGPFGMVLDKFEVMR